MGVEGHNLYTADVTRTLPVDGTFTPLQRELYDLVYAAQAGRHRRRTAGRAVPRRRTTPRWTCSPTASRTWACCPCSAEEALDPESKVYAPLDAARHQPHARHGRARLRRRVDATSTPKGDLAEGMVLTVEPGLYFQDDDLLVPEEMRGIGIRIEDDILVTADGSRNLSASLPRTSADVEAWMAAASARWLSPGAREAAPSRPSSRKSRCDSSPICTSATSVNPASSNSRTAFTMPSRSGPQGIESATSSLVTNWEAPAKPAVPGSSAFTFHPPPNQRNSSWARSTQASRS